MPSLTQVVFDPADIAKQSVEILKQVNELLNYKAARFSYFQDMADACKPIPRGLTDLYAKKPGDMDEMSLILKSLTIDGMKDACLFAPRINKPTSIAIADFIKQEQNECSIALDIDISDISDDQAAQTLQTISALLPDIKGCVTPVSAFCQREIEGLREAKAAIDRSQLVPTERGCQTATKRIKRQP